MSYAYDYSGSAARPYTSMYHTEPSRAATVMGSGTSTAAQPVLAEDVRESMDFIARYCRGERMSPTPGSPSPNDQYAASGAYSSSRAGATYPAYTTPSSRQVDRSPMVGSSTVPASGRLPAYTLPAASERESSQQQQLPSWAYRGSSAGATSTAAGGTGAAPSLGSGPGGNRQRAMVSETVNPYQSHSPVRYNSVPPPPDAPPHRAGGVDAARSQPAALHEPHKVYSPPSTVAPQPPANGSSQPATGARGSSPWSPSAGAPPPRSDHAVISRYESFPDDDRTLLYIAMWMKSYFSDDVTEHSRGAETLSHDDVQELLKCYSNELLPLIDQLKPKKVQPQVQGRPDHTSTAPVSAPSAVAGKTQRREQPVEEIRVDEMGSTSSRQEVRPVKPAARPPPQAEDSHRDDEGEAATKLPAGLQPRPSNKQTRPPTPSDDQHSHTGSVQPVTPNQSDMRLHIQRRQIHQRPPIGQSMQLMRKGSYLVKYARNGSPLLRYFTVTNQKMKIDGEDVECPHLSWASDVGAKVSGSLPLIHLQLLEYGAGAEKAKIFKRDKNGNVVGLRDESIRPVMCFILTFEKRTMGLYANSQEDYEMWVDGLESVIAKNRQHGTTHKSKEEK